MNVARAPPITLWKVMHVHIAWERHVPSRREDGFSLVELVVVVAVLGMLGSIVLLSVDAVREYAEGSVCRADLRSVQAATDAFEAQRGRVPDSLAELVNGHYLKDYPEGTSATSDGVFEFVTEAPAPTVTRPC